MERLSIASILRLWRSLSSSASRSILAFSSAFFILFASALRDLISFASSFLESLLVAILVGEDDGSAAAWGSDIFLGLDAGETILFNESLIVRLLGVGIVDSLELEDLLKVENGGRDSGPPPKGTMLGKCVGGGGTLSRRCSTLRVLVGARGSTALGIRAHFSVSDGTSMGANMMLPEL